MWALIGNGRVLEVTEIDPAGRFHESLQWEECPAKIKEGMVFSKGVFSEYVEPKPSYTDEQIEAMRLRAYADPFTGSDRYFAEASRMKAMGEEGWESVRNQGVVRYQEIQAEYPWND